MLHLSPHSSSLTLTDGQQHSSFLRAGSRLYKQALLIKTKVDYTTFCNCLEEVSIVHRKDTHGCLWAQRNLGKLSVDHIPLQQEEAESSVLSVR